MKIEVQVAIHATREEIWDVISDIENSDTVISGIEKLEILKKPENGLVGLKWRETRTMFGKEATETMWITDSEEYKYYQTRAESHGSIYKGRMIIEEEAGDLILKMQFSARPVTLMARILSVLLGFMMKGPTKKLLLNDLRDVKAYIER